MSHTTTVDFALQWHGSIRKLEPLTPAGQAWIAENLPDTTHQGATVIEPRYVAYILDRIERDGLRVRA